MHSRASRVSIKGGVTDLLASRSDCEWSAIAVGMSWLPAAILCSLLTSVSATYNPCIPRVYIGTSKGALLISMDGGDLWETRYPVPPVSNIRTITAVGDNVYIGTDFEGLRISRGAGRTWPTQTFANGGPGTAYVFDVFAVKNRVWVSSYGRLIFSNDSGETWPVQVPLSNPPFETSTVSSALYVSDRRVFVGTSGEQTGGIGVSDDDGNTWKFVKTGGTVTTITGTGRHVYAGVQNRDDGAILLSDDHGHTWGTQYTTQIGSVTSISTVGDKVYVATRGGGLAISDTKNAWRTWVVKSASDGLSNTIYKVIAAGGNIYVETEAGILVSRDGGQIWADKTPMLPEGHVIKAWYAHCP